MRESRVVVRESFGGDRHVLRKFQVVPQTLRLSRFSEWFRRVRGRRRLEYGLP